MGKTKKGEDTRKEEWKQKDRRVDKERGDEEVSDVRVEHGAVVVNEVCGDELMSGLCGAKTELNHTFLS